VKEIELPRRVLIGDGVISKVAEFTDTLNLSGESIVVCDHDTEEVAGRKVADKLGSKVTTLREKDDLEKKVSKDAKFLLAVGGGRIIDATKIAAYKKKIPFISIPTAASHDGIVSPMAAAQKGKPTSIFARCPLGVIADTKIISKAPARLFSAGCADAISNYTAVLDWRLARDEKGEYYGDYAAALSEMSARIVMENAKTIQGNTSQLVEALISSGVAIGISGSSRPCSGSEHNFSHALDSVCKRPALHGEQCGVGTIMMARLHEADWLGVRAALEACGAPTSAAHLGIPDDKIIKALTMSHKVRDRYTILRGGLDFARASELARETRVIE